MIVCVVGQLKMKICLNSKWQTSKMPMEFCNRRCVQCQSKLFKRMTENDGKKNQQENEWVVQNNNIIDLKNEMKKTHKSHSECDFCCCSFFVHKIAYFVAQLKCNWINSTLFDFVCSVAVAIWHLPYVTELQSLLLNYFMGIIISQLSSACACHFWQCFNLSLNTLMLIDGNNWLLLSFSFVFFFFHSNDKHVGVIIIF